MAQHYESEITQFLNQYKQEHRNTEQRQREGRALLWDRQIDSELQENFRAARLPMPTYVYQTE